MPFVNVKMTKTGKGQNEKEKLIEGITSLLHDIYGKPPEVCHVLIEEYDPGSWGWCGQSIAKRKTSSK